MKLGVTFVLTFLVCVLAGEVATAAVVTVGFNNDNGLGFGVGVTQTLTNIDPGSEFKMTDLSGSYEVTTVNPAELNLKDFAGNGTTRSVEFTLQNGQHFDFDSVFVQDNFGAATFTSDKGGSKVVSSIGTTNFSGATWQDISELTITTTQQFGEFKIPSLTFNDAPTVAGGGGGGAAVPLPNSLFVGVIGVFCVVGWARVFRRRMDAAATTC